jgi:hypothetical protein
MSRTNGEPVAHEEGAPEVRRAFRFAGKFLLVATGVIAALLLFRFSFAFSRWAGFTLVGILAIVLYTTAPRWVGWLRGLLVFGVFNSLLGLTIHHALNNPRVTVSAGVTSLLLAFYLVGWRASYYYDSAHLSAVDRCAWLVYFACMTFPACVDHKNLATVTPDIAWSVGIGVAAIGVSLTTHRMRRRKSG